MTALFMIMLAASAASAASVNVVVNGDSVVFPDAAAYINDDGRTMVPVRFVSEQLGARVGWDQARQSVSIDYNGQKISIPINQKLAFIGSKQIELDTAAVIKESRTMVPLRFVSEALGARVLWSGASSTVRISEIGSSIAVAAKNNKYKSAPPMTIDPAKTYYANVKTNRGEFKIKLLADKTPKTVNNFVFLAKDDFYDGVSFHRIMKGFMIQTGDPLGSGTGGPGYAFADELPPALAYGSGVVAMANSGANTNGSQFFICNGEQSKQLNSNPNYTVFGQVVEGMDTVLKISDTPVEAGASGEPSKPMEDIIIEGIDIN